MYLSTQKYYVNSLQFLKKRLLRTDGRTDGRLMAVPQHWLSLYMLYLSIAEIIKMKKKSKILKKIIQKLKFETKPHKKVQI